MSLVTLGAHVKETLAAPKCIDLKVANHLREQFKAPEDWLPGLREHVGGLDEAAIRQTLLALDTAWNLFTEWTQADTIFRLISRVTIYPDRAGIRINLPALA